MTSAVWNWSRKNLSPGALLALLCFSLSPFSFARFHFPLPPRSAPGSPRMRMSMTAMERYYTKHQPNEDDPCLKLRCYARERFFFPVKTFHLFNDRSSLGFQSLPDRSRKSVTNELFQELCKITSILLVQIIGDPYFFHHESLTLLTIYKI